MRDRQNAASCVFCAGAQHMWRRCVGNAAVLSTTFERPLLSDGGPAAFLLVAQCTIHPHGYAVATAHLVRTTTAFCENCGRPAPAQTGTPVTSCKEILAFDIGSPNLNAAKLIL